MSPDPMLPEVTRIQRVRRETADSVTLWLEPPAGRLGFSFLPGQFSMLYAFGVGEAAISISGDPGRSDRLGHTVRAAGAVTRAIVAARAGDQLGLRGPFGRGWPLEEAEGRDLLLIAGGLGLAPLRPVLYQLLRRRPAYGRVTLLYGARSPEELLYRSELRRWRARAELAVQVSVDRAGSGWDGEVGVVTALIGRASFDPARALALVCGPEVMMRFCVAELRRAGVDTDRIHLSIERNMKCAIGLCGHCQYQPWFVCKDGAVFSMRSLEPLLGRREL